MVSQKLLTELEGILERKLKRKPTAEEVSEYARRYVEFFELARKIDLQIPKPVMYFAKFDSLEKLKELYAKSSNISQSV